VGIVAQQVTVFLHIGAAAGGVGDDEVDVCAVKGIDGAASQRESVVFFAGVDHQCAAARLILWSDHFVAFSREHANRGGVDLRKKFALDATEEQADAETLFALRGSDFGDAFSGAKRRHQRFKSTDFLGEKLERAGFAEQTLQAGLLIEEQRPAQQTEAARVRKEREEQCTVKFFEWGARMEALDLCAGGFEEFAVVDAGGAGGHACHAAEARVEVLDPGGCDLRGAFGGCFDEMNAAAGGIHFFVPEDVGGAGGEAEAAVDAFLEDLGGGRMVGIEGGDLRR